MDEHIREARDLVAESARIIVLTGAGISAESGIPIFRGAGLPDEALSGDSVGRATAKAGGLPAPGDPTHGEGGLAPRGPSNTPRVRGDGEGGWRNFRPEDLATPEAFERDPKTVWEWYDWRRQLIARAEPNDAHRALVRLENAKGGFSLATQNVDGLHQRAGSRRVFELHGNLWTLRCTGCGEERIDRTVPLAPLPPRCGCGAVLRPAVVWFGEPLPADEFDAAMRDAEACELMLVVGTSAIVHPAVRIAHAALAAERPVIEVNPDETPLSPHVTLSLRGPAGALLPQIVD